MCIFTDAKLMKAYAKIWHRLMKISIKKYRL